VGGNGSPQFPGQKIVLRRPRNQRHPGFEEGGDHG
jgi:hypothetical protein